jgi:hypothetical protein
VTPLLTKHILTNKYKNLVLDNKEKFLKDIAYIKSLLLFDNISFNPLLIYSNNKRNALYYVLSMFFSLKKDRVLDYAVITGQTLIDQHFASEKQRDHELYNAIYYSDISFISLSQYDYTGEFLESQLINLIEFRQQRKKITVVSYDVMDSLRSYAGLTKKLHSYFASNEFQIIDITSGSATTEKVKSEAVKTTTTKRNKRIV